MLASLSLQSAVAFSASIIAKLPRWGGCAMAIALTRIAVAAVLLSSCSLGFPLTPDAFRQQMVSDAFGKVEKFEVNRSLRDVASTFRERASACLEDVKVSSAGGPPSRYRVVVNRVHPKVLVTDRNVELHVQIKNEYGSFKVLEEPADGYYVLVTQAFPIDGRRTRIEMFGGHETLHTAVKGWAAGTSSACPDLS